MNPNNTQNQGNFAYPGIGQQAVVSNNDASNTTSFLQQPVQQSQPTNGLPVQQPTQQPVQQSQPANGLPVQQPTSNNPVDQSNLSTIPTPSNSDTVVSNPDNSTGTESPLQALAKKLSNLKDEFVEEVPQTTDPAPQATTSPPVPQISTISEPVGVIMNSPMQTPNPVPTPQTEINPQINNSETLTSEISVPVQAPQPSLITDSIVTNSDVKVPQPTIVEDSVVPSSDTQVPQPSMVQNSVMPSEPVQESGKSLETLINEEKQIQEEAQNASVVADGPYLYTIDQLFDMVVERDASDLHITVGYPVMIRVDGDLQNVGEQVVTEEMAAELILAVLSEQKKELLEVNREVDLAYAHGDNARFRINAYYQKESIAAAFRLIPSKIRTIEELKLPQIYNQLAKLKQGLVLVTGPTGSGKSTTLAAILQEINMTRPDHLITIEDPIEYVFPKAKAMVDQREMHEDTHSWEIALKSALRQDPDVMLVGEMRDFETISAAITLAETGHLVFATLHTNSASQTVDRIIDVFPEHQQPQVRSQLSHVIESVIAQRLIPLSGGGRAAVSEIMIANPAVKNLIREGKTHQLDNVIMTSADVGMISLEHSLVKLVRENQITMEMAQEYAVHPEEVVRLLKS
jgi:twitching motility protein PilT